MFPLGIMHTPAPTPTNQKKKKKKKNSDLPTLLANPGLGGEQLFKSSPICIKLCFRFNVHLLMQDQLTDKNGEKHQGKLFVGSEANRKRCRTNRRKNRTKLLGHLRKLF